LGWAGSSAVGLRVGCRRVGCLGSGEEHVIRLERSSVDGEHHALLTVVGLEAEEPQGVGIRQRERPGGEIARVGLNRDEARGDTDNVRRHRGVRQLRAGGGESRLRNSVVLRREDESHNITSGSGDIGGVVSERLVLANHDGVGGLSSGVAGSEESGSESETHIDNNRPWGRDRIDSRKDKIRPARR